VNNTPTSLLCLGLVASQVGEDALSASKPKLSNLILYFVAYLVILYFNNLLKSFICLLQVWEAPHTLGEALNLSTKGIRVPSSSTSPCENLQTVLCSPFIFMFHLDREFCF
jgi:hypothetical protein